MPGTFVTDALAPDLFTGATLNATGATTGDVWTADRPQEVTFFLTTGTVTGTTPTLDVAIQGCDTADFTTDDVVTFAEFGQIGDADDTVFELTTRVTTTFVRAEVTVGGTSPVFTGSTLVPQMVHHLRTALNSAAALA